MFISCSLSILAAFQAVQGFWIKSQLRKSCKGNANMGQHSLTYGSQYEVPRSASHRNLLEMQFLGPPPQTSWVRNSLKMDLITNTSFENTVSIKYTKNRLLRKKRTRKSFWRLKMRAKMKKTQRRAGRKSRGNLSDKWNKKTKKWKTG